MREVRTVKVQGLRAEKREGKQYLSGHVAVFGAVAEIGAGNKMFRERVMPGAFARAIREGQDVRHLQNHDPNRVLGRTSVKTTVLSEDETGLRFETLLPDTSYARDLAVLVDRGDVNEGSFGFECRAGGDRWVKEGGIEIRDLVDVDLFDVSTVTFPAYTGTNAELSQRAMFPDGLPAEIRSRLERPAASAPAPDVRVKESRQRLGVLVAMPARAPEFRAAVQADGTCELSVYGDIGEDFWSFTGGITAKWVRTQLDAAPYKQVRVCINSAGGDAFEAIAIYNVLRAQGRPVAVRVDGLAASAASIVAMAGDTIVMGSNCLMMIHNASDGCYGTADEHAAMADALDTISTAIAQTYVDRTKMPMASVQKLMDAETWMNAADCLAKGFCTEVSAAAKPAEGDEDPEEEMLAMAQSSRSLQAHRNVPERLKAPAVVRVPSVDAALESRRQRLRLAMAR
ncbi:MAG: HK97 family phage prohead protease [Acidobacteriia bacterium]|nr:HK97 family phage prohead protease [Terriglobia bacterium]